MAPRLNLTDQRVLWELAIADGQLRTQALSNVMNRFGDRILYPHSSIGRLEERGLIRVVTEDKAYSQTVFLAGEARENAAAHRAKGIAAAAAAAFRRMVLARIRAGREEVAALIMLDAVRPEATVIYPGFEASSDEASLILAGPGRLSEMVSALRLLERLDKLPGADLVTAACEATEDFDDPDNDPAA
ncbi:hypothetical protein [Miltoncostaea oceani]|uniref:hypothetical protein n=1 Tax=Miltoncostaea oceani TaxID=2843216 RepID=UPI001C3C3AC3|nr:hypothetical protein [Miltoncostaea oceani]